MLLHPHMYTYSKQKRIYIQRFLCTETRKLFQRRKMTGINIFLPFCTFILYLILSSKVFLFDPDTEGVVASGPQQSPLWGSRGRGDSRDRRGERTGQTLRPVTHTQPQKERHHPPHSNSKSRPVLPLDPSQHPAVPRRRRGAWADQRPQHPD